MDEACIADEGGFRMKRVKQAKWIHIVLSAVLAAAGLCLILWPTGFVRLIGWLIGGVCVLIGAARLIGYFSNDLYRLAFQFDLALGIFTILLGLLLLSHTDAVMQAIPVLTGMYILVDSVFKVQTAFDARRFGLRGWWAILAGAVLGALGGVLLVLNPFAAGRLLSILVGAAWLADGLLNICITAGTVKVVDQKQQIEAEYEIRD